MKPSFLFTLLLTATSLLFSCKEDKTVFAPVENNNDVEREAKEIELNNSKQNKEQEIAFIEEYLKKQEDSLGIKYEATPYGTWSRKIKEGEGKGVKQGDKLSYQAEIRYLSGDLKYTQSEFSKELVMGKEIEIEAIESQLKTMKEGEEVEIVTPSYFAYGLVGDNDKIGISKPLLVKLGLTKVTSL